MPGKIHRAMIAALGSLIAVILLPAADKDDWKRELLKERAEKDAEFKNSSTSPMAGRERLILSATDRLLHFIRDGRVADPAVSGPAPEITIVFRGGEWFWRGASGAACRRNGGEVAKESEPLRPGDLFTTGRLTLAAYPGPDTLALIVFDPERPQAREFRNLLYYPPDRNYAVKAKLERFAEAKPLQVITTRDLEKTFYRYGKLRFRVDGRDLELTALKSSLEGPEARYLFVPFKDDTNGRETYEVGRFLDLEEPQGGEVDLDFNRCYNPLCNYSPAYNCPLPPLENFLEAEIRAGEKAYPH
jgi:uncharacterized protein (DUF1684 family)